MNLRSALAQWELSIQAGQKYPKSLKEKQMIKNIKAERQSPNSVPTPLKKQEPTNEIWKKGGAKSPDEALSTDKNSVRNPVDR